MVTHCGRICLGNKKINFSQVFAGQAVGIKEVHDDIWLVSFMDYDLGYFDLETRVLEPLENPFGPRLEVAPDARRGSSGDHRKKTNRGDAIGPPSSQSSLLQSPGAKFLTKTASS